MSRIVGVIIAVVVIGVLIFLISILSCNGSKNIRVDRQENRILEGVCTGDFVLAVFKIDKQIAREFFCQCTSGGVKSDANNCRSIINNNNSDYRVNVCKDFTKLKLKSHDQCERIFEKIK